MVNQEVRSGPPGPKPDRFGPDVEWNDEHSAWMLPDHKRAQVKERSDKQRTQGMNWVSKQKRLALYIRDGFSCSYCHSNINDGIKLTLDHIIPRIEGGSNHETNLVTTCKQCNEVKGDRNHETFIQDVAQYIQAPRERIAALIDRRTNSGLEKTTEVSKKLLSDWKGKWKELLVSPKLRRHVHKMSKTLLRYPGIIRSKA